MPATKSSNIWERFKEMEGDPSTAICQIVGCKKKEVSRGKKGTPRSELTIESLKNHLKNNHKIEYKDFLDVTQKNKAAKRALEEDHDDSEMENDGVQKLFNIRTHGQRQKYLSQMKISSWARDSGESTSSSSFNSYKIDDARAKERHVGVLAMIVLDLQPFSVVSDPGFIYYSNRMDPHFKLASETYYRTCLSKAYEKGFKIVVDKVVKDDPVSVSCQLDGWSSYRHGYMGLLINYITPAWKRVSICVGCAPFDTNHSGQNIGEWLDEKLSDWKVLDKTTVCVSDTASNMLKSMEYLPNYMVHNGCLNHILQLSIDDEILKKPAVKNIIMNLRAIANYASKSNLLSGFIRKVQKEAGIEDNKILMMKQDCVTRWNSTYDMIERAVVLEEVVKKVLEDDHWKVKIKNKDSSPVRFSSQDWKLMKNVESVLKPFKESTLILSKADACISQSIPVVASLLYTLKPSNCDTGVKDLKARLKRNLLDRVGSLEESDIHAIATLLDPRYKNCVFRDEQCAKDAEGKLLDLLKSEIETAALVDDGINEADGSAEVVEDSNNNRQESGLFAAMRAIKKKPRNEGSTDKESVDEVLKEFISDGLVDLDVKPLSWWAKYQEKAGGSVAKLSLCKLAKKYLTPPPTSTNCERLFAIAGQVMDEKRANLLPERLDMILFLRENIKNTNFNLDW